MEAAADRAGPGAHPQRVLIVDDEPDHLRLLLETLRGSGFEIATATTGAIGLRTAAALGADLILLDVKLPDTDGFTLCRRLKQDAATRDTPVIFLTGQLTLAAKTRGFESGGVDYIVKPFESAEVLLRVCSHLTLARRRQTLETRLALYEPPPSGPPSTPRPPPLKVPPETPTAVLRMLTRARDRLLTDLRCTPRLRDIAAYAGTNRTTLGQIFRIHFGMSVFDYLREERLAEGRRLLTESSLSLTEIADTVGYRYGRDFAWAFKRRFGVAPTAFRERGGGAQPRSAAA